MLIKCVYVLRKDDIFMKKIFDVNNELVNSISDVVDGMFNCTSKEGKLLVTVLQDEGYVKIEGHYDCDMDKEMFDLDYDGLSNKIQNMVESIKPNNKSNELELKNIESGVINNYFEPFILARVKRISRLKELNAPQIIINHEIKAFTYYWILNHYCVTL